MARALFFDAQSVLKNTSLQSDIDPEKLIPHIEWFHDVKLVDFLGTKLSERLLDLVATGVAADQTGIYDPANSNYYRLIYSPGNKNRDLTDIGQQWAAWHFIGEGNYTIDNKGIFKEVATGAAGASDSEVYRIRDKFRSRAEFYQARLYDHLCQNSGLYPEYYSTESEDLPPSNKTYRTPWL